MKAMVIRRFGGPEVFEAAEVPQPEVRPGHIVIRVAASSVNPVDQKIRSGGIPGIAPEFPAVLHGDVAGTVESVGEGVAHLSPGDEVYACAGGIKGPGGALAEFLLTDAALAARKPASLTMLEAATLPLVGITAWESLVDRARVEPGQRVLIHGGAGGVGQIAIQIARQCGAMVHVTVSTDEKAQLARGLGADHTILYRQQKVEDYVRQYTDDAGFDVVFDTVGQSNLPNSFAAVRRGGTVVTIAARVTVDLGLLHAKGATLHTVLMLLPLLTGQGRPHHGEILTRLARLVDAGRVKPLLDPEIFAFRDIGAAHRKLENGLVVGKLALEAKF